MNASTTLTIAGRIDIDSFLDLHLHVKSSGWAWKGDHKINPNGSISLLVVAPCNADEAVASVLSAIPNFDGIVLSEDELADLTKFDLDAEETQSTDNWY